MKTMMQIAALALVLTTLASCDFFNSGKPSVSIPEDSGKVELPNAPQEKEVTAKADKPTETDSAKTANEASVDVK